MSSTSKPGTSRRPVPDFKKLHQEWDDKLQKRKAFIKKPCTAVEEFHLGQKTSKPPARPTPSSKLPKPLSHTAPRPSKRPVLGELQPPDEVLEARSPKRRAKPAGKQVQATLVDFKPDAGALRSIMSGSGVSEPTDVKFRPSRVPLTEANSERMTAADHAWVRQSIYHNSPINPRSTACRSARKETSRRAGRVPRNQRDELEFCASSSALESILSNRGIQDENARPSTVAARGRGNFGGSTVRQSIYANVDRQIAQTPRHRLTIATPGSARSQLRLAATCRPSMTAQRVPVRPSLTSQPPDWCRTTGSIRTLPATDNTNDNKDWAKKTLRFEDDDDDVTADDAPSSPKRFLEAHAQDGSRRERRPSADGEQTKIQFRQRKLARSPGRCQGGGAGQRTTPTEEAERLKELEKREKAMKLKIHLQKLKQEKENKKKADEKAEDDGGSPKLQRTAPCTYTMMTSQAIDDVIGLTPESGDEESDDVINNNNDKNSAVTNDLMNSNNEKDVENNDVIMDDDVINDESDDSALSASLESLTLDQLNRSIMDCDDELHGLAENVSSAQPEQMRRLIERQAKRQASILARQAKLENLLAKLVETKATKSLPKEEEIVVKEIEHAKPVTPSRNSAFVSFSPAHRASSSAPSTNAQISLARSVVRPNLNSERSAFARVNVIAPPTASLNQSESISSKKKVNDWLDSCQDIPLFKCYWPKGLEGVSIAARLLDEEVEHYLRSGPIRSREEWSCDRPHDPVGQSLIYGDEMHFVPVHAH